MRLIPSRPGVFSVPVCDERSANALADNGDASVLDVETAKVHTLFKTHGVEELGAVRAEEMVSHTAGNACQPDSPIVTVIEV